MGQLWGQQGDFERELPPDAAPGHAPVPEGRTPLRGGASYEAEG